MNAVVNTVLLPVNAVVRQINDAVVSFRENQRLNATLQEENSRLKKELESLCSAEYRLKRLETENTELRDEISALKDTIDTMWKIYNPGGEYPDWSKYTLDQLIAMKDELPIIIHNRIMEAYAEGML